jgi:hypothetical protein
MVIVTGRLCLVVVACPGVGASCYPSHERFVLLATPPSKSVAADMVHPAFQQFITLDINHIRAGLFMPNHIRSAVAGCGLFHSPSFG